MSTLVQLWRHGTALLEIHSQVIALNMNNPVSSPGRRKACWESPPARANNIGGQQFLRVSCFEQAAQHGIRTLSCKLTVLLIVHSLLNVGGMKRLVETTHSLKQFGLRVSEISQRQGLILLNHGELVQIYQLP